MKIHKYFKNVISKLKEISKSRRKKLEIHYDYDIKDDLLNLYYVFFFSQFYQTSIILKNREPIRTNFYVFMFFIFMLSAKMQYVRVNE